MEDTRQVRWQFYLVIFVVAILLTVLRNPAVVTNAQFYSEDGSVWYADAYNLGGAIALTIPAGGYLNTLPRLVAWFSLLFPLQYAPLVMNFAGIIVQALPAPVLLSGRCKRWGSTRFRLFLALIYIMLPNSREVNIVLTNAQFHLALLVFLVVVAEKPESTLSKVFDLAVLSISPLSGPFCLFLLPIAFFVCWRSRQRWSLISAAILASLSCIQVAELLAGGYSLRSPGNLGASPMLFLRLLAGHVYLGSLIGLNAFAVRAGSMGVVLVALAGSAIVGYAAVKGPFPIKLLLIFSALLLVAALKRPLIAGPHPQWELLATDRGARYWFFPTLAFSWAVVWCAAQKSGRTVRVAGTAAGFIMLFGIYRDYRYPAYTDMQFPEYVSRFNNARAGDVVNIPVYPKGALARLIKK